MTPEIDEINYRLRPAKSIERKMMADLLQKVGHIKPIREYQYIGFGSIFFSEFRLFHRRFGIEDMVNIEKLFEAKQRVDFNKPFDCIKVVMEHSQSALDADEVNWEKPTILWLDYTSELRRRMLHRELQKFFSDAEPGSVFFVTLNAQPPDTDELDEIETHKELLKNRFSKGTVPRDLDDNLEGPEYGNAFRRIIMNKIEGKYLRDRNIARAEEDELTFEQLCNFIYTDTSLMMTLGGILLTPGMEDNFEAANFEDLDFFKPGEDQYRIGIPSVTFDETRVLEKSLPNSLSSCEAPVPDPEKERFKKVYRYFPRFTESEL